MFYLLIAFLNVTLLANSSVYDELASAKQNGHSAIQAVGCENKKQRRESQKLVRDLSVDRFVAKDIISGNSKGTREYRSESSINYQMSNGKKLKKGEALYFRIPKDLWENNLSSVQLAHGQPESKSSPEWYYDETKGEWRDKNPAMTSVQLYDVDEKKYYLWCQGYSGTLGAKFADAGIERETLQEFPKICGCELGNNKKRKCDLKVGAMRLVNVGSDSLNVYGVGLMTIPRKIDSNCQIHEFGKKTKFGDVKTFLGTKYGGGDNYGGKYPGALALGKPGYKPPEGKLPPKWKYSNGRYIVPLKKGKKLKIAEFIIGDRKPDGVVHSEGIGSKGAAFLDVELQNGESRTKLVRRRSVPPAGIVPGYPKKCGETLKSGSKLIVQNSGYDPAYILGVRICYAKESD